MLFCYGCDHMDLKSLRYFLAIAEEGSISAAAESLHLSQPNLSRQISALERELGVTLMVRGNRRIELTEEGVMLRRRASEILELAETAKSELASDRDVRGTVSIGGGETDAFRLVARAMMAVRGRHPGIDFRVHSGNADDVTDRLDHGLMDFGVLVEPVDKSRYDFISFPVVDRWGLMVRDDDPIADAGCARPEDVRGRPLIVSQQSMAMNGISGWLGTDVSKIEVRATYNLLYNASLMVSEGLGSALCLEGIVGTGGDSGLRFLPLDPPLEVGLSLVWKKGGVQGKAQKIFLDEVKGVFASVGRGPTEAV